MSEKNQHEKTTLIFNLEEVIKKRKQNEDELALKVDGLEFTQTMTAAFESDLVDYSIQDEGQEDETGAGVILKQGEDLHQNRPKGMSISREIKILLFDFNSDFFHLSFSEFPAGHDYHLLRELSELNQNLTQPGPQILVLYYNSHPKIINSLCLQVKKKFPQVKIILIAQKISPEKVKLHRESPAGADGYYALPLEGGRLNREFEKIIRRLQKAS